MKIKILQKIQISKIIKNKQNIKLISAFFVGILLTSLTNHFINNNKMMIDLTSKHNKNDKIVAKISGEKIYLSEINQKLSTINPNLTIQNLQKEDLELVAKDIYAQKIILKNALKNNSYEKYSPFLRNFAIEETKNNYLQKKLRQSIDEEQIKSEYQTLIDKVKDKKEYEISHILTKNKSDIYKARNFLNNNSFANAVAKFSIDTKTKNQGGNLGYIVEGTTIEEFEKEFKKLKVGKTSRPFKTKLGWHIVKLNDIRDVVPAQYETAKERILDALAEKNKKPYILKLIEDAKVEIL